MFQSIHVIALCVRVKVLIYVLNHVFFQCCLESMVSLEVRSGSWGLNEPWGSLDATDVHGLYLMRRLKTSVWLGGVLGCGCCVSVCVAAVVGVVVRFVSTNQISGVEVAQLGVGAVVLH